MADTYTVKGGEELFTFAEDDEAKSICQNVALIISTKKGSVPMYRGFGIPMKYLDRPMPEAKTLALSEITEAVEDFEPRAEIVSVNFTEEAGKIIPTVEVKVKNEQQL